MHSGYVNIDWEPAKAKRSQDLCRQFLSASPSKRFIFGRNSYSKAVASQLDIAAFVDDFADDREFLGSPVIRTADIPSDAIVLAASGGRPLTVRRLLAEKGVAQIDYFSFLKWAPLDLPEAVFNEGFQKSFDDNRREVDWLFNILENDRSRDILRKLLSFRYTYDLDCLDGFEEKQASQYFESFVDWNVRNPVFVDVGGFDGATAESFMQRSPDYKKIYVFEPDKANFLLCQDRLAKHRDIDLLPFGAGSKTETLCFSQNGSASAITIDGELEIEIRKIDDIVKDAPTFIKMDIEGAEGQAIEGARQTIAKHRPALAICVYHRPTDFWILPRAVLAMNSNYKVFLEHYTESIYETVMYFLP